MRDPTIPHVDDRKKIMFYDSADRQTKLRIRCELDGISQSQFFRMMITGYIEKDESVLLFLSKCKERFNIQGQQKRSRIDRTHRKSKETEKKFDLQDEEIESIFDIIETETGL